MNKRKVRVPWWQSVVIGVICAGWVLAVGVLAAATLVLLDWMSR